MLPKSSSEDQGETAGATVELHSFNNHHAYPRNKVHSAVTTNVTSNVCVVADELPCATPVAVIGIV